MEKWAGRGCHKQSRSKYTKGRGDKGTPPQFCFQHQGYAQCETGQSQDDGHIAQRKEVHEHEAGEKLPNAEPIILLRYK
jgi:hypothetical protein